VGGENFFPLAEERGCSQAKKKKKKKGPCLSFDPLDSYPRRGATDEGEQNSLEFRGADDEDEVFVLRAALVIA